MTLTTNANFDAKHDVDQKAPNYIIHFDGETTDYAMHTPGSPDNTIKNYLVSIKGRSQTVTPEKGRATVGSVAVELLDANNELTALWKTDSDYFHRKKTTIKAGYVGMDEADFITIFTGWITGKRAGRNNLSYILDITDPKKWFQRNIFRTSEDTAASFTGNAINLLLAWLTSTGAGTNGDYDWFSATDGLGLDTDHINISAIEQLRDDFYPRPTYWMSFSINERQRAIDFFEKEIFQPLNLYPIIDGQGRFSLRRLVKPLPTTGPIPVINDGDLVGVPGWSENYGELINEVRFSYDYDAVDDEFDTVDYIVDGSINTRGPGKEEIHIESKGFTTGNDAALIAQTRAKTVFNRFAPPPIKINITTRFDKWIEEAGTVIDFSSNFVPDIVAGTMGISNELMEIIDMSVDWLRGLCKITLLQSGFDAAPGQVISPTMTVTAGTSATEFSVSAADAAKYANFTNPEVIVYYDNMIAASSAVTITDITGTTVTVDSLGFTPSAGMIVAFANYDSCTTEQKRYGFIADSSDNLGAANDDAHVIVA